MITKPELTQADWTEIKCCIGCRIDELRVYRMNTEKFLTPSKIDQLNEKIKYLTNLEKLIP